MRAPSPFTDLMISNEVNVLRRLHGMLEHDPIQTREEFVDLMKAAFVHGKLEARNLADDLGFNFTTVYRWIEGHSAPHVSLWPRISSWIINDIDRRIRAHDGIYASEIPKIAN